VPVSIDHQRTFRDGHGNPFWSQQQDSVSMKSNNNYTPYSGTSGAAPYNNTSYLRQSNGSTFDNVDSNRSSAQSASAYRSQHQQQPAFPPAPPATYYNGSNSFYIQQKQQTPPTPSSNLFRETASYQRTSNPLDQPLNPLNLSSYNRYQTGGQHVTVTHQTDGKIKDIHVIDVNRKNQTPLIQ
jgi:hypothetical protein